MLALHTHWHQILLSLLPFLTLLSKTPAKNTEVTVAMATRESDRLFEDILAQKASEDLPVRLKLLDLDLFHNFKITIYVMI